MDQKKVMGYVGGTLLLAMVVFVFLFVWPSLYRYERLSSSELLRINRVTGTIDHLDRYRWVREKKSLLDEVLEERLNAPAPLPDRPRKGFADDLGLFKTETKPNANDRK